MTDRADCRCERPIVTSCPQTDSDSRKRLLLTRLRLLVFRRSGGRPVPINRRPDFQRALCTTLEERG